MKKETLHVTLCKGNADRVELFNNLTSKNFNCKKFTVLEVINQDDWDCLVYFFNFFKIPIPQPNGPGKGPWMGKPDNKGKLARWLAVIMLCKYVIDNNQKTPLIFIEDDINIPPCFDFKKNLWKENSWNKLSEWGEAFAINKEVAIEFLFKLYELGIDRANDLWIMENMNINAVGKKDINSKKSNLIGRENLIKPSGIGEIKKCGHMTQSEKLSFQYKSSKSDLDFLINYKLFESDNLNFKEIISNLK
tara:strand:- start:530 stop:1273 length:744 start_codon:yes stop_codon:yes gene_type:complete